MAKVEEIDFFSVEDAVQACAYQGFEPAFIRAHCYAHGISYKQLKVILGVYCNVGNNPNKLLTGNKMKDPVKARQLHNSLSAKRIARTKGQDVVTLSQLANVFSPVLLQIRKDLKAKDMLRQQFDVDLDVIWHDPSLGPLANAEKHIDKYREYIKLFSEAVGKKDQKGELINKTDWTSIQIAGAKADSSLSEAVGKITGHAGLEAWYNKWITTSGKAVYKDMEFGGIGTSRKRRTKREDTRKPALQKLLNTPLEEAKAEVKAQAADSESDDEEESGSQADEVTAEDIEEEARQLDESKWFLSLKADLNDLLSRQQMEQMEKSASKEGFLNSLPRSDVKLICERLDAKLKDAELVKGVMFDETQRQALMASMVYQGGLSDTLIKRMDKEVDFNLLGMVLAEREEDKRKLKAAEDVKASAEKELAIIIGDSGEASAQGVSK